jgi:hypothetical protein
MENYERRAKTGGCGGHLCPHTKKTETNLRVLHVLCGENRLPLVVSDGRNGHSWSRLVKAMTYLVKVALKPLILCKILFLKYLQMKTKKTTVKAVVDSVRFSTTQPVGATGAGGIEN